MQYSSIAIGFSVNGKKDGGITIEGTQGLD